MAGHTEGPWSQVPQHGAGPMIARRYETGKQMNPVGLRLVCHVLQRGNSLKEDEANARLIAAAPDLLTALKGVLPYMEKAEERGLVGDEGAHWPVELVRAAIAKAESDHA